MTQKILVLSDTQRAHIFGSFNYEELSGGRIKISPRWIAEYIVPCRLAQANGHGQDVITSCHRLAKEPLEQAFMEISKDGLWKLIHSFDGLWVTRHKTWNSQRALSSHSWGIAFDLNADTNPYDGSASVANQALNEIFNRYGFAWGGDWQGAKDAMHWELADVSAWQRLSEQRAPRLILGVKRGNDFSYHVVPGATLTQGSFTVDAAATAQIFGRAMPPGPIPLRDLLAALGMKIMNLGDSLHDVLDPRYYVFVA